MKLFRSLQYTACAGLLCLAACKETKKTETANIEEKPLVAAPLFNEDSAYTFVAQQVAFGPRVPNTKAHDNCGEYLAKSLEKYGCQVIRQKFTAQSYDGKDLQLTNIIGSINPQATKRILLVAHWDSRHIADQDEVDEFKPIDAANDGGSGVGILLEVARTLSANTPPSVGVDIIFFDGEDYGAPEYAEVEGRVDSWCLGSQYWSKNKHTPGYSAYFGILLDMVGAKNARFNMEGASVNYAGEVVKKVWNTAQRIGQGSFFIQKQVGAITDDHIPVNTVAKIPMVDIIEWDGASFSPSWHTHSDNMGVIDKATLKAVGQTLVQVVYNE